MRRKYNLGFIDDNAIYEYTKKYVLEYRKSINLTEFNSNIVDPIKLTFDSKIYGKSIEDTILDECIRQLDKSNSNVLGYFHQNLFTLFEKDGWVVPKSGFDIENKDKGIYVEMKNKHNTMNAASSRDTFLVLQNKAASDNNAKCMLVEVIAKKSQNVKWEGTFKGNKLSHDRVFRVSIDQFYKIAFNQEDAFFKLCEQLPNIIEDIIEEIGCITIENTVIEELNKQYLSMSTSCVCEEPFTYTTPSNNTTSSSNIMKQLYLLAFSTYEGFDKFK